MALIFVSLFVLAPFALLVLDFSGRGPKRVEPAAPLAPSYGALLEQTGRYGSRTAPSWNDVPAV